MYVRAFWLGENKDGFVLADMEDMFYTEHEITLQPGDRLYLYTDGVTEAMNKEHELFGDPRLLETIDRYTSLPLKEFAQKMKSEIDKIAEGTG